MLVSYRPLANPECRRGVAVRISYSVATSAAQVLGTAHLLQVLSTARLLHTSVILLVMQAYLAAALVATAAALAPAPVPPHAAAPARSPQGLENKYWAWRGQAIQSAPRRARTFYV